MMKTFLPLYIVLCLSLIFSPKVASQETSARKAKLQECRQCHEDVFSHWKKGPHANSYKRLLTFQKRVTDHAKDFYEADHMAVSNTKSCLSCHAPQNLFEVMLPDQASLKVKGLILLKEGELSPGREDTLGSGVDCLNCHVQGNQVFTRSQYRPNPAFAKMEKFCNPQPSTMFDNGYMCYPCHSGEVSFMARRPFKSKGQDCASCHSVPGKDGHWDHYYHWIGDLENGVLPDILKEVFEDIEAQIQIQGDDRFLQLSWANRRMPHLQAICTEFVLHAQVLDTSEQILFEVIERTHRKKDHEKETQTTRPVPDSDFDFSPDSPGLQKRYPLPAKLPARGVIRLHVRKKSQYFAPDDHFPVVYQKDILY
jgi:hypothetical protein